MNPKLQTLNQENRKPSAGPSMAVQHLKHGFKKSHGVKSRMLDNVRITRGTVKPLLSGMTWRSSLIRSVADANCSSH